MDILINLYTVWLRPRSSALFKGVDSNKGDKGFKMRQKKPDLLFVLSFFLLMGVVLTGYASQRLNNLEFDLAKAYAPKHQ